MLVVEKKEPVCVNIPDTSAPPPPAPKPLAAADEDTAVVKLLPPSIRCPKEAVVCRDPLRNPFNAWISSGPSPRVIAPVVFICD